MVGARILVAELAQGEYLQTSLPRRSRMIASQKTEGLEAAELLVGLAVLEALARDLPVVVPQRTMILTKSLPRGAKTKSLVLVRRRKRKTKQRKGTRAVTLLLLLPAALLLPPQVLRAAAIDAARGARVALQSL